MAKKRINVSVDEEFKQFFDHLAETSEYDNKKKYVVALIREDAEERDISVEDARSILADDEDEQPPLHARYDPDEYDDYLSDDEQKAIVKHDPEAQINPDHVRRNTTPQGWREEVVTAMARYEFDRVSRDDVVGLCKSVGLDSNYFLRSRANDKNIPGKVTERLGGSGKAGEKVGTMSDGEKVQVSVSAALLRYDGDQSDYETVRDEFQHVKRDTDVLSEEAASVVSRALFEATDSDDRDIEELRTDWPDNPLALVDLADEKIPYGLDEDVDRGAIAGEIGDVLGEDVPVPLFADTADQLRDTAGEWSAKTRDVIDNEALPPAVLEARLETAEEVVEANADHPSVDRVQDVLDDLREEIEARKADDDEQEDETEDAGDEQTADDDDDEDDE